MPFGTSHRAYVSAQGRGYGRYAYNVVCSCGAQLGTYNSQTTAERVARQHERKGK